MIEDEKKNIIEKHQQVEKIKKEIEIFYNGYRTLTHNCLFNFIIGERGCGKTFWFKEWAIRDFIKNGWQFAYVRRYKDELKESLKTFFDDVSAKFPDHTFSVKGNNLYIDCKLAGYGMVLSTAKKLKSVSFPLVNKMCFDEFLIEKSNLVYLQDEVGSFLNLYETVARPGSGHCDVVVFFMANAISWTNPYFLYFDVDHPTKKDKNGKNIWKNGDILVEVTDQEEFKEQKKQTRFGKIVNGTRYGDYSINNKFLLDDDTFLEEKSKNSKYCFTFTYNNQYYGVWVDTDVEKIWVSKKVDKSYLLNYAITLKDHNPNTLLMKTMGRNEPFRLFLEYYKRGRVYFEDMNIKNITYEVIKMTMHV